MAESDQPPTKRAKLSVDEAERMSREELVQRCLDQDTQIENLLNQTGGDGSSSDYEEKYRQLQQESARRENVLVMRLTAKDQEVQELMTQNEEMKRAQNPSTAQLRGMLLDPAINLMFQRMKKEMEQSKEKLEQAQNDLAAWKFTPDGQTGKRLMAKCRMLLQENSELGKVISAGRTAKLEGEIALGKRFVEEMKQSQAETEEFLVEMDEDVEGLQSTILLLQSQLKEAKDQIQQLQQQKQTATTTTTTTSQDAKDGRTNGSSCDTNSSQHDLRTSTSGGDRNEEVSNDGVRQTSSNGNSNHHGDEAMDQSDSVKQEEQHRQSKQQQQQQGQDDVEGMEQDDEDFSSHESSRTSSSKAKLNTSTNETTSTGVQNGMAVDSMQGSN